MNEMSIWLKLTFQNVLHACNTFYGRVYYNMSKLNNERAKIISLKVVSCATLSRSHKVNLEKNSYVHLECRVSCK